MNAALLAGTIVMAVFAVALARGRDPLPAVTEAAAIAPSRTLDDWRDYAATGQRVGATNAALTLVVFSDFQCPYCRALAKNVGELMQRDSQNVAMVFRHFPLAKHTFARQAAIASECAARQGRFRQFHDALFAAPEQIGTASWSTFASRAGVRDSALFARCLTSTDAGAVIERDVAAGRALGVAGTPTVIVNGLLFEGPPPLRLLDSLRRIAVSQPWAEAR